MSQPATDTLASQPAPFFNLLGSDPAHKRFLTIAGGHVTTDRPTRIRETLDWLDRYLGPVKLAPR